MPLNLITSFAVKVETFWLFEIPDTFISSMVINPDQPNR
jgi:hypothetical protein